MSATQQIDLKKKEKYFKLEHLQHSNKSLVICEEKNGHIPCMMVHNLVASLENSNPWVARGTIIKSFRNFEKNRQIEEISAAEETNLSVEIIHPLKKLAEAAENLTNFLRQSNQHPSDSDEIQDDSQRKCTKGETKKQCQLEELIF